MARGRVGDEAGVVATQLAVLMPALLLLVMLAVQFGLWAHASQLARAAADHAAHTAALPDATAAAGHTAAGGLLAQAGNLTAVEVTVKRGPAVAVATVTGTAPQVVPGLRWRVSASAAAPVERFIPQPHRFAITEGSGGWNPGVGVADGG
jgi:Flp pilus assembly protein TadG